MEPRRAQLCRWDVDVRMGRSETASRPTEADSAVLQPPHGAVKADGLLHGCLRPCSEPFLRQNPGVTGHLTPHHLVLRTLDI